MPESRHSPLLILLLCLPMGHVSADPFEDGLRAANAGEYARAREIWTPAGLKGDARAQYGLGVLCLEGKGGQPDPGLSTRWFRAAALQGYRLAQFNLGNAYKHGTGALKNEQQATYWWTQAAEKNLPRAQFNLGTQYYFGRGVETDRHKALEWYRAAAKQGFEPAQRVLGQLQGKAPLAPFLQQSADQAPATAPDLWPGQGSGNQYTLQLAASHSLVDLQEFQARHQIQGHVFRTLRGDRAWFSLVQGVYPTWKAAKAALDALPESLRANGPWLRRIRDIQSRPAP